MEKKRTIVITSALPYANGDIHIGHMVEHFQTDMWARFQKMRGHDCLAICADDTHGTPIMVNARKQGITPEELIAQSKEAHEADFRDFEVAYDNYSSTNTPLNREVVDDIYKKMQEVGDVEEREVEQSYCQHDKMFLPDRFVKGTCPKCGSEDQYGDQCEKCMATYNPLELKDAACSICGNTPVAKNSMHYFFKVSKHGDFLKEWIPAHAPKEVAHKLGEWLDDLQDWCISRDDPYFGFEIPGSDKKFYYVWMDAPVGYISSTMEWCARNGRSVDHYWKNDDAEIYHNIGKDIIAFHNIFWPTMLKVSGWNTPKRVQVHGMLNVNGEKMSKSRGTFINARTYLDHLDPTYLRYYFACKINDSISDLDFNTEDFVARVNSDLIGKITNVASRGAQMLQKKLDGKLGKLGEEGQKLMQGALAKSDTIAEHFESFNYSKAMLEIRSIADEANKYFDSYEPWKLIKDDPEKTREVLTTILNLFRVMAIYLKPVLPSYVTRVESLFGEAEFTWDSLPKTVESGELSEFSHLLTRIDPKKVDKILSTTAATVEKKEKKSTKKKKESKPETPSEISFEDFMKVDLRVARVAEAEFVEGADKLLRLKLDIGCEKTKQVFAGIRTAYDPKNLVGQHVVMVANLKPRKMKFGMSEGMVIAAGPGGTELFLVRPDEGAQAGMRIS